MAGAQTTTTPAVLIHGDQTHAALQRSIEHTMSVNPTIALSFYAQLPLPDELNPLEVEYQTRCEALAEAECVSTTHQDGFRPSDACVWSDRDGCLSRKVFDERRLGLTNTALMRWFLSKRVPGTPP